LSVQSKEHDDQVVLHVDAKFTCLGIVVPRLASYTVLVPTA
jgi:hypothetical protein